MYESPTERHNEVSKRMLRALLMLVLIVACAVVLPSAGAQQGGKTRYVYDANGRLVAVVSPAGEAVAYDYDRAGNITAIRRLGSGTLVLLGFFPQEGGAGDEVTFVGTGFGAGATSVSFNGALARVVETSPSSVIAEVPDAATTGPVIITTPLGTLITPAPFTVVARARVLPSSVTLPPGASFTFTAVVGGGGDQNVTWSVNGIDGGSASVGTISANGLYTAPGSLTGNQSLSVKVRATSVAQPLLSGESTVRVINPNSLGSLFAPMVSVRRGDSINGSGEIRSPLVSVRLGEVIGRPAAVFSPLVSITIGPNISSISPASVARGATATLTITGSNLSGATALRFINAGGAIDTTVAASNLIVNDDGASLAATVIVGGSAAIGERVLVVSASAGSSLPVKAGSNTIQIVP
jgi:YD repeat-containing protein